MLECLEYFTVPGILAPEDADGYSAEAAKEKISLLKRVLDIDR